MQNPPVTEADTVAPKAYSGVADLNDAQKLDLKEIWEHAAAITSAHIVLDATTEQDFLRAIFAGSWNSDIKPMKPSEPSRSSQESSFAAGFFKEDLPGTNGEPQDVSCTLGPKRMNLLQRINAEIISTGSIPQGRSHRHVEG